MVDDVDFRADIRGSFMRLKIMTLPCRSIFDCLVYIKRNSYFRWEHPRYTWRVLMSLAHPWFWLGIEKVNGWVAERDAGDINDCKNLFFVIWINFTLLTTTDIYLNVLIFVFLQLLSRSIPLLFILFCSIPLVCGCGLCYYSYDVSYSFRPSLKYTVSE